MQPATTTTTNTNTMSQITGFVDENRIVGKEIDGDVFELVAGQMRPKLFTAPVPAGMPGSVAAPDMTPTDLVDPGDGLGGPATPVGSVLHADGTWKLPVALTRFRGSAGASLSQNNPTPVTGTQSGLTQAYTPILGQTFYVPSLTIETANGIGGGSVQLPIPVYPVLSTTAVQPDQAGGLVPSAKNLAGRADVYFASNGKWEVSPLTPPTGTPANAIRQADGTWIVPAAAPTTSHTASFDAIGKNLTTVVNGVSVVTSLAALDDEATSMAFSAGTLQLKNAAGTVLSSTPIPDLDAQTLTLTGNTIAISGGNSITLPTAAAPTVSNTVTGTGTTRTLTTTVSGVTGAAVAIPDTDAQTLTLTGQTLAISGGNSVTLPAVAPTTNVVTWNKVSGLVDVVDGVSSSVVIAPGTVTDVLGYDATGKPVYQPVAAAVLVTDNANGTVTINAGAGQSQTAIRPIDEQAVAGTLTAADKFTVLDNGTTNHQSITLADLRKRLQSELATAESVANAPGGVIPATKVLEGVTVPIDTYVDYNGSYASPVTLPVPVHNGQRLVFNHLANLDTTVSVANSSMTAPLVVTTAMGGAEWIAINGKWHLTTPAPAVATATTHVNTWTKSGGLAESVNGVASNIVIAPGTITDLIGYNAAGAPVNAPLVRIPRILEEYKAVAASATHAVVGPNADTQYDTYYISTTIEITAPGVTYTLPVIPPALSLHRIEIDVKCLGTWTGSVAVAPGAGTIDGATSYSFTKAAATGVNANPNRRFKWANSRWFVV